VDESRKEKLVKELQGMAVGVAGLFILLSLLTFSAADQSFNSWSTGAGVHNLGGRLGAQVADLCLMLFGLASYLLPGLLLLISYHLLRFKELRFRFYKAAAFCGLLIALSALFAFNLEVTTVMGQQVPTGGAIGALVVRFLKTVAGPVGALLVLLPLLAASIMVLSGFPSCSLPPGGWKTCVKNGRRGRNGGPLNVKNRKNRKPVQKGSLSPPALC